MLLSSVSDYVTRKNIMVRSLFSKTLGSDWDKKDQIWFSTRSPLLNKPSMGF